MKLLCSIQNKKKKKDHTLLAKPTEYARTRQKPTTIYKRNFICNVMHHFASRWEITKRKATLAAIVTFRAGYVHLVCVCVSVDRCKGLRH